MRMKSKQIDLCHQRYLRGGRQSEPLACYAITKCVEQRRQVLGNETAASVIIASFDWLREQHKIKLLAFCVMPDHYHVLFVLLDDSLSDVMKSVGKHTATQINKHIGDSGQFWQDGFHDHQCRDIDDVLDRMTYIERNPV